MEEKEQDKLQEKTESTAVSGTPEPSENPAAQEQSVTVVQTKTRETMETVRRVATPEAAVEMVQTKTKETTETVRRIGTQETSVTVAHTKETNTTKRTGSPDAGIDVNWPEVNEKALLSGPVSDTETNTGEPAAAAESESTVPGETGTGADKTYKEVPFFEMKDTENEDGADAEEMEGFEEDTASEPETENDSEAVPEPETENDSEAVSGPEERVTLSAEESELPGEEPEDMRTVVGVRFRTAGKAYYFDAGDLEVRRGSNIIVETIRGIEFGTVVGNPMRLDAAKLKQPLKKVVRLAAPEDIETQENNKLREREAFKICQDKIRSHGLDMKLIDAEYTFDNSKVLFYFTADGRVDFRDLVKDLASVFRTRIELRQIGVRDETKILGGYGVCGRPLCCHTFLSDFAPVSIKMAKEQNLSLNPTKISGVCGRLMCCLKNEEETYEELNRSLPKPGDEVQGNDGLVGEVDSVNVLRQKVRILVEVDDEKEIHEYNADEVTLLRRKRRGSRSGSHGAARNADHEKKGAREGARTGRDSYKDLHGAGRGRDSLKKDSEISGKDRENPEREAAEGRRESRKEFRRDSRRDFGKNNGKEAGRASSRDDGKAFGKGFARESGFRKESGKDAGRDKTFGKDKALSKETEKYSAKNTGRETGTDAAGEFSGEVTENSEQKGGRDSGRNSSRRERRGRYRSGGRGSRRYGARGEASNGDTTHGRENDSRSGS